ncbi:phosphate ABC transporter substrate-binding protein PstS [Dactylosporangium siamense]|uniref:phosphate ABC transporter substrate-binding protein PstS n=1 Tax=Dactylosporangium siamense TaxID=685454 RepID=UPI00194360E8|nr:phosphate ABC transporter substrate-binding protein PstS [Dactylosporangium siamense]
MHTSAARTRLAIVAVLAMVATLVAPATPALAVGHARITGTGSSWSANALNQWVADVQKQGLQVDFTPTGSATGRKDFAALATDFGITDIGFRGEDPKTKQKDTAQGREFAYLPIVAGGTAFVYQVRVGGQLVRNIRMSGETLAKIFFGQITNWNDAQISADNNGRKLPSLPIIVVAHSEGSGSTAQFTSYLANQYPSLWRAYNGSPEFTEYFPPLPATGTRGNKVYAVNGSDGVINTVTAGSSNGAIGYDEYSYALGAGYPVVKLENKAGYFTSPSEYNVAVALTAAELNMDPKDPNTYLLQKLDKVYINPDRRTYPMSSYSYMLLPIGDSKKDPRINSEKRQTLVDFMAYSICTGQRSMGATGYSPLPVNLVEAGFTQLKRLNAADAQVTVAAKPVNQCNNPTFDPADPARNHLAQIAPNPADCDKRGAGPCAATGATGGTNTAGGNGSGGTGTGTGGATTNPSASGSAAAAGQIDPDTGEVISGGGGSGGGDANAVGVPNDLAAFTTGKHMKVLGPAAAALLLLVVFGPALLGRWLRRRREQP